MPPVELLSGGGVTKVVDAGKKYDCEGNSTWNLPPLHIEGKDQGGKYSIDGSKMKGIKPGQEVTIDNFRKIRGV